MHAANSAAGPARVAILAFAETTASVMYGMYDLFHSAGRDWGVIENGVPGPSLMLPMIVSVSGQPLDVANGVRVCPDRPLDEIPAPHLICIPELVVTPSECLDGRFDAECAWLRAGYKAGAVVASACSGALLMAQAACSTASRRPPTGRSATRSPRAFRRSVCSASVRSSSRAKASAS